MTSTYTTQPSHGLCGELAIPGDKSITHRALILSAIAEGTSTIHSPLMAEDTLATLNILRQLGVSIEEYPTYWEVHGVGLHGLKPASHTLDCQNAGTAFRLLAGVLAGQSFASTLTGDASLQKRPMQRIIEPLTAMGVCIQAEQNRAPLSFHPSPELNTICYTLPIPSAQVKSAILLAGLYTQSETVIIEPMPTRDHTTNLLQTFAYPVQRSHSITRLKGQQTLVATELSIPSDISSAAFFIVAATLVPKSEISLKNIGINPRRMGMIHLLKKMGADIQLRKQTILCGEPVADIHVRSAPLHSIEIKQPWVSLAIDEIPILAIAAACAKGKTIIHDASELRVKESDRLTAIVTNLRALGIDTKQHDDNLVIQGGQLQGGKVDSFHDHRIAMAFIIAGLVANNEVKVQHCQNIATSFPEFFDKLKSLIIN